MREHFANRAERRAGNAEQTVVGVPEDLGERIEAELGDQIVGFANRSDDGVLDRHDADVRARARDGDRDVAVRRHAERGRLDALVLEEAAHGQLRVGAVHALKSCDHVVPFSGCQERQTSLAGSFAKVRSALYSVPRKGSSTNPVVKR